MSISLEKQKKAIHQKENELELRKKLLKESLAQRRKDAENDRFRVSGL